MTKWIAPIAILLILYFIIKNFSFKNLVPDINIGGSEIDIFTDPYGGMKTTPG